MFDSNMNRCHFLRLRRRDFEFKSHDIVSIIKELKNGSDPSRNKDENLEKVKIHLRFSI